MGLRVGLAAILSCVVLSAIAQAGDLHLRVNGRDHPLPAGTGLLINDQPATLDDLRALPDGLRVEWVAAAGIAEGAPPTPVFSYALIGPVTRSEPLEVLGQALTITAGTVLANASFPVSLPVGTPVVVAGLVDANGSTLATLLERRGQAGNRFLLTGPVMAANAGAGTLQVGLQPVSAAGTLFSGCAGAWPAVGEFVSLRTDAVTPWVPGSVLQGVANARCVSPVPAGTPGATGFLQGLVSALPAPQSFAIGSLLVRWNAQTAFVAGASDDLAEGVPVNVDGAYVGTREFVASVVEFVHPAVRFEAPLLPADVQAGLSLRPFGVLVRASAQLRDDDGILANGLTQPRQVEVRGYVDRSGHAHATRVRERGPPDPGAVRLRGPVEAYAAPQLRILGLQVDTSGATFVDELGVPLAAGAFFAGLAIGHEVDVSGASWNPATATLSGGVVTWIGAEPVPPPPAPAVAASVAAGTAAGYSWLTPVFVDGFGD